MSLQQHRPGLGSPYGPFMAKPAAAADPEATVVTGPRRAAQGEATAVAGPRVPWLGAPAPGPVWSPGPSCAPAGRFAPGPWAPAPGGPPTSRRMNRTWALVAAATAATVAVVGTAVALTAGSTSASGGSASGSVAPPAAAGSSPAPTTAAPPAIVPVNALPGLLPDPAALNPIVGSSAMTVVQSVDNHMDNPKSDTADCLQTYHPAEQAAYQGSGWIAMRGQLLHEASSNWQHVVIQAVVSFPTAQAAADFVTKQHDAWVRCQGKSATANYDDGPETYTVNTVNFQAGVLTAQGVEEGGGGWRCQHALTARNNVVADVASYGFAPDDQATAIVTAINGRLGG